MTDSINAEVRAAVEALITEFSYRVDHGEADRVPELFVSDGLFDSPMATLEGAEQIAKAFEQRARADYETRHVISNIRLLPKSADRIEGTVLLTMYRWKPDTENLKAMPSAIVEYDDVYVRGDDGVWRFASRKARPVLQALEG